MFISKERYNTILKDFVRLEKKIVELKQETFRVDDPVYVTDGKHNPKTIYYIKGFYNGKKCAYITEDENKTKDDLDEISNGIFTIFLSHEYPKECTLCGHLL